ncbi:MAG: hypothetical protein ACRDLN_10820, partial [Solirubrobacteraceae bacterium]
MPLDRPPRPPVGALTDRVRGAILAEAQRRGLDVQALLALHVEGEHVGNIEDLVGDLEERHHMQTGAFLERLGRRMFGDNSPRAVTSGVVAQVAFGPSSPLAARAILMELPEAEFLTAIEHALQVSFRNERIHPQQVSDLYEYTDETLRAHGTPYRAAGGGRWEFAWIGDPKQHELTVIPALLALDDPR